MLKRKQLNIPTLNAIVILVWADRETFTKKYKQDISGNDGVCLLPPDLENMPTLWVDHTLPNHVVVGLIAHECNHAVDNIFMALNQPHEEGNEEIYSTTLQYLVTEMYKFYTTNKDKYEKHELDTTRHACPISLESTARGYNKLTEGH